MLYPRKGFQLAVTRRPILQILAQKMRDFSSSCLLHKRAAFVSFGTKRELNV